MGQFDSAGVFKLLTRIRQNAFQSSPVASALAKRIIKRDRKNEALGNASLLPARLGFSPHVQ